MGVSWRQLKNDPHLEPGEAKPRFEALSLRKENLRDKKCTLCGIKADRPLLNIDQSAVIHSVPNINSDLIQLYEPSRDAREPRGVIRLHIGNKAPVASIGRYPDIDTLWSWSDAKANLPFSCTPLACVDLEFRDWIYLVAGTTR